MRRCIMQQQREVIQFDILEIARAIGLKEVAIAKGGKKIIFRCPFCGDSDNDNHGHFYIEPGPDYYKCYKCGHKGRYAVNLYASIRGINSKSAYRELVDNLRAGYNPQIQYNPKKVIHIVPEEPIATIELRHTVYQDMLGLLNLSPSHLSNLQKRGLPDQFIVQAGYKSYPENVKLRWAICEKLSQKYNLSGIPGFYLNKASKWDITIYPSGILIPVRDEEKRIQGMQIRYLPFIKEKHKDKYRWLSSVGKEKGTGATTWIHFVIPEGKSIKKIWLTEGPLKADAASLFLNEPFAAVPGTSALGNVVKRLKSMGVDEVVLAFDADQLTNIYVKKAMDELEGDLKKNNLPFEPATWPTVMVDGKPEPRGIDDACLCRIEQSLPVSAADFIVLKRTTVVYERVTVTEEIAVKMPEVNRSLETTVMDVSVPKPEGAKKATETIIDVSETKHEVAKRPTEIIIDVAYEPEKCTKQQPEIKPKKSILANIIGWVKRFFS